MKVRNIRNLLTESMQAPQDVLDWLQKIGFRRPIVATIAAGRYDVPPTLAAMQASVAAMQEVLHMSDAQVRCKTMTRPVTSLGWLHLARGPDIEVESASNCAVYIQA